MPAATASWMNATFCGVWASRFVPRPMRGTSTSPRRAVVSVLIAEAYPPPGAANGAGAARARPVAPEGLREDVELGDRPPGAALPGLDDAHVACGLRGEGGDDERAVRRAARDRAAPGSAVVRDDDLVAAGVVAAARARVHDDPRERLRGAHVDLEPVAVRHPVAAAPARAEVAVDGV